MATHFSTAGIDMADQSLKKIERSFNSFLKNNPESRIVKEQAGQETLYSILDPWGDGSLKLRIPAKPGKLSRHLNKLRLPPKFSAVWHKSSGELEVIWTAFKLSQSQSALIGRAFSFSANGTTYQCEFRRSSESLLQIARAFVPVQITETNHRNLLSFNSFTKVSDEGAEAPFLDEPRSFWISNLDLNEDEIPDLAGLLNFYLTYFDTNSPMIVIHSAEDEHNSSFKPSRYPHGDFPAVIESIDIDDVILSFWSASMNENAMLRFLLFYRIIEYAASHFLEVGVRAEIKKILAHPSNRPTAPETITKLVERFSATNLEDIPKLRAVIKQNVSEDLLWREIEPMKNAFVSSTEFDGGFVLPPLLSSKDTFANFKVGKVDQFADKIRMIRNALAHGKDLQSSGVITPTRRNMKLLEPWTHLIRISAGEVAHYNQIT